MPADRARHGGLVAGQLGQLLVAQLLVGQLHAGLPG